MIKIIRNKLKRIIMHITSFGITFHAASNWCHCWARLSTCRRNPAREITADLHYKNMAIVSVMVPECPAMTDWLTGVYVGVFLHVWFLVESLAAILTRERTRIAMNQQMRRQSWRALNAQQQWILHQTRNLARNNCNAARLCISMSFSRSGS